MTSEARYGTVTRSWRLGFARRTTVRMGDGLLNWTIGLLPSPRRPWWIALRSWTWLALVAMVLLAAVGAYRLTRPIVVRPTSDLVSPSPESTTQSVGTDLGTADPRSPGLERLFRTPAPARAPTGSRSNVTLSELTKGLELQGVLATESPRAIIYNSETGQTIHVSPGEYIGDILVVEVRDRSVLLSWKDERMELDL